MAIQTISVQSHLGVDTYDQPEYVGTVIEIRCPALTGRYIVKRDVQCPQCGSDDWHTRKGGWLVCRKCGCDILDPTHPAYND